MLTNDSESFVNRPYHSTQFTQLTPHPLPSMTTTTIYVRDHFRLDLPHDLACVHCNRVLVSPCMDKQGRMLCKSCFKQVGQGTALRAAEIVLRQLRDVMLCCIHCSQSVQYSQAKTHIQRQCSGMTRTMEEEVEMGTFDVVSRVCADLNVVNPEVLFMSNGNGWWNSHPLNLILNRASSSTLPAERGITFSEGVYATNYGRLICVVNGALSATSLADYRPLPIKIQWHIQHIPLGVFLTRPDAFLVHIRSLLLMDQVATTRTREGVIVDGV